jgi:hypothetical protein
MITEKKLIEKGFYKDLINDNIYFIKNTIRLEKCFGGYILEKPYKFIKNINELKDL